MSQEKKIPHWVARTRGAQGRQVLDCSRVKLVNNQKLVLKSDYEKAIQALKIARKELSRLNAEAPLNLSIDTGVILSSVDDTLKELGELL